MRLFGVCNTDGGLLRVIERGTQLMVASEDDVLLLASGFGFSDTVRIHQKDFFDLDPRELADQTGIICLNPPYGRRLGGRRESEEFFKAICKKLKQAYTGWKLVLIAPSKKLANTVPFQTKTFPVFHGGLKLVLMVGLIK